MPSKCAAITRSGAPCRGLVRAGSEYCPAHAPERAEARRRAASLAGRSKPGSAIGEVKAQLRRLANDVLDGAVDRGTGSVTAQILGVWLKAAEVEIREREAVVREGELQLKVTEQEELRGRLEDLEALLQDREEVSRWAN